MPGVAQDIRLPQDLLNELYLAEQLLNKDRNWIISRALREYLRKAKVRDLREEARKQSILASRSGYDEAWEENMDANGWRS